MVTGFSRLNVSARLIIGFIAIFVVTTSVSVYSIIKLNQFNKTSTRMLDIGDRMIGYKERLSDALLSEVSYEKKYFISRDYTLHKHYISAGKDFGRNLNEAGAIADTPGVKAILDSIAQQHGRYRSLVEEESKRIMSGSAYRPGWYKAEKDRTVEAIIEEIKNLELYIEDDTKSKIEGLAKAGTGALKVALAMAVFSLLSGVLIAFGITRSITRPLYVMKRKTRQISGGNFGDHLDLSSPPEIGELARSFNMMCDRLSEMDRMKSEFFSLMAHELRTPLSSIKAGINLLKKSMDRSETGDRDKILAILSEECNRLIDLVNSLLDLSRMEAGIIDFDLISGDVRPLLEKALTEIEPLFAARKISFDFNTAGECRSVMIDSERMLQVIRNLLGNAVKFTPDGGRIKILLKPVEGGLEFSVADSGPGIPEEDRAMIFDKFKQAQAKAAIRGTGLGLAIVKHVVDAHGGKICVKSELGKGSIFTVFLPS